ncbi:MAG: hypothetical protein ABJN35_06110 [Erythrobacter sp.]
MIKTMSRMMVATAAVSMAFAPIAAQANTRAADNAPVYTSAEPGAAVAAEGEELRGASGILITLLAAAAAIAGIIAVADSEDDGQSPGT